MKNEEKPVAHLGAGIVASTQPYAGTDMEVFPVPLFSYEGKRFYVRGLTAGYRVWTWNGLSIGPVIQPRFEGYESDDSPALAGMGDRDWSLDGGAAVNWLTDIGLFGLSFVTDLLGRSDGQELEFSYTILFERAGFDFIPSAGVRWKSGSLADYYYGVRQSEETVGRPRYEANDAVDPYLRLTVRRKLDERWSLLGAVQYEWLSSEIQDSPIVEEDYDASFLLGLLYSW